MNSTSKASTSSAWVVLAVVLAVVAGAAGVADAGKKRVVVLDFEGPKSAKFHDELVKLIKKTHTVISTDKWNGTAEEMDAADISDKNVKKVAKKLKVDAVVEGKIEKRRDEYIIRLKLRSGVSGAIGTSVDTKADSPKIDGRAQREIKEELLDAIDSTSGGGGGDDEDEPVAKKAGKKKLSDDEDEPKPVKKGGKKVAAADDEDEDKPAKKGGFSKHFGDDDKPTKGGKLASDDEDKPAKPAAKAKPVDDEDKPVKPAAKAKPADDEDALPPKKVAKKADDEDALPPKKAAKKVASDDEDDHRPARKRVAVHDDDGNEVDAVGTRAPLDRSIALSPGERSVDAAVGFSVNVRRLSYTLRPDLRAVPPVYKGVAAPGYAGEATVYPLAIGHTRDDVLKDIGLHFEGSRAIKLNSKFVGSDGTTRTYHSFDSRFGVGATFRFAFGRSPTSPVVSGGLMYTNQRFGVTADSAKNTSGVPNVRYKMVEPNVQFKLPITAKIIASADARIMAMLDTGQQQSVVYFGTTKVTGYEGLIGVDYHVTPNIFARVEGHIEAINLSFKGNGQGSANRDMDPTTIDVSSARDVYFGGFASVGYAY
jgi:hypothetical protein